MAQNQEMGFEYTSLSRSWSFGRKRVLVSNHLEVDSCFTTPSKKHCGVDSVLCSDKSALDSLPQDILVRILCGVEHDDLKRLFDVSKSVRAATVIAKRWHFAFSTPTKKLAFKDAVEFENWGGDAYEVEAPNAPKHSRTRSRLNGKNQRLLSRRLFMELETEI